ncbi:DUF1638 domain-containing protein [Aestuariispira ectoiniformans]|uniref:DUF1638 domain-containing protein n=1 Tax=Aestuariispira ectoiniformans TaxID=2775080 RepID=UPI00223BD9D5|nr:DUF1638 domain-containing protein [Aestuariispira ectoiniformans]
MTTQDQKIETPGADQSPEFISDKARVLIIACGALAREILDIIRVNGWEHVGVTCLPAKLHNRPDQIPERLREKIRQAREKAEFSKILIGYADCGTGGLLDQVIAEEGVERIGGPHCYSFFAGSERFNEIAEQELGSFYLTDYLVRAFDTLIMEGMGLNKYPEMRDLMFGNYKRLVYLAQVDDPELDRQAEAAAEKLGLAYEKVKTGYGELADFMAKAADET